MRFQMPDQGGYKGEENWVCFNDACSYYVEGWEWMKEQYERDVSYRYRLDPATGHASPLPVWSPTALRERILGDVE